MSAMAMRRSPLVLERAQSVFGDDLVKDAFVCVSYVEEVTTEAEIREHLDFSCERLEGMQRPGKSDSLAFDAETIRLVFCNGRVVEFSTSEWATMGAPDEAAIEA